MPSHNTANCEYRTVFYVILAKLIKTESNAEYENEME